MRTIIPGLLAGLLVVGSLSVSAGTDDEPEVPEIGPDHGFTVEKSPVLYFYVSKSTSLPVYFTLNNVQKVQPIAEFRLPSPTRPGFWPIRLGDHQVELEEDVQYRWYVSVSRNPDGYSQDIVAGGLIERVGPRLVDYYGHGCDQDSLFQAEKAGLWIDAFACLNKLIEANPDAEVLGHLRERLWRQKRFQSDELPPAPWGRRPGCSPVC